MRAGEFGEHAHRGDVGGCGAQVRAQQRFGFGNPVGLASAAAACSSAGSRARMTQMRGVGFLGAGEIADRGEMVAEREPCARQFGLQRDRATQRRDGIVAASATAERDAEFELHGGRLRLLARQRFEDARGAFGIAAGIARSAEQQQRDRMAIDDTQDLRRLAAGERRIRRQQPRSVCQRSFDRSGRLVRGCHVSTVDMQPPTG